MERPNAPQLDALLATVEAIHAAEARLRSLKEQVAEQARALSEIADPSLRLAAGVYAYWYAPEVNASDIALGAIGEAHPSKLLKRAGPVSVGIPCDRCEGDLPIHSRTQMKTTLDRLRDDRVRWPEGYRVLCDDCEAAVHADRRRASEADDQARAARRRALAALPYADYLETQDWRTARDEHLWYRVHDVHTLECETCTSQQGLGVYHKTHHGTGRRDDLILLCLGCRDALAAAGRLAGQPGPRNRLSPRLILRMLEAHQAELGR